MGIMAVSLSTRKHDYVANIILIKAMVQAIPSYAMSSFNLPVSFVGGHKFNNKKFLVGQNKGEKCVHWMKWDRLCEPNRKEGIGFQRPSKHSTLNYQ